MGWYHFEAMDGGGAKLRVLAAFWAVACVVALLPTAAEAQSPPAGTPKILLAFDASGSMAADDGAGTPKIQAAQDAAVDLLGSLPPSTQVGLRVFGGTKPSRPIGPACRDSSLVLPIGPLDRSQAEQQIRSFKAKGRTPIAYALERAAEDLGTTGPRTIILVSDGKDTCQPPSPCTVAERIARGGVEMRIQAIGFNVDKEARDELKCIARAGGGAYTDADNAQALKEQLRVLSTRALRQYVPKGKPVKCGPSARRATSIVPGRYLDGMPPDSECWYAVELRRGETLKASTSWIPPRRDIADHAQLARGSLDIVTPSFEIPDRQNSSSGATSSSAGGSSAASAPCRARSASAARRTPTSRSPSPGATTSSSRSRTPTRRTSSTPPAASPIRSSSPSRSSAATAATRPRRRARSPRPRAARRRPASPRPTSRPRRPCSCSSAPAWPH